MECELCGQDNPPEARFCSNCGTSLVAREAPSAAIQCPQCGQDNPGETFFCTNCGADLTRMGEPPSPTEGAPLREQGPAVPERAGFWTKYRWPALALAAVAVVVVVLVMRAQQAETLVPDYSFTVLEFRELVEVEVKGGEEGEVEMKWIPATGVIDGQEKALTSRYFKENTYVARDSIGGVELLFKWTGEGSKLCEQITQRLIGKPMGIFVDGEPLLGEDGKPIAPIVQSVLRDSGRITGLSRNEATELSRRLNAAR